MLGTSPRAYGWMRGVGLLAALLPSALLSGGCGSINTLEGPALPAGEVAVLEGYSRFYGIYWEELYISAVDGRRPELPALWAREVTLLPGSHWVELSWSAAVALASPSRVCVFEAEFAAGSRYRLVAHSLEVDARRGGEPGAGLYRGTVELAVRAAGQQEVRVRQELLCAEANWSIEFCRDDADCRNGPDWRCRPLGVPEFGRCAYPGP